MEMADHGEDPRPDEGEASEVQFKGEALPVRIRPADERDAAFVYSSWLKSYSGQFRVIPRKIVYEFEGIKIKNLLEKSITLVAVGNSIASAGDIYGYMCGERTPEHLIIHYAYTKMPFRRWGLARSLLDAFEYKPGELIIHSYKGYIAKELKKSGFSLMYVPYLRDLGTLERWSSFYGSNKADL
jgi:hypothetical protein